MTREWYITTWHRYWRFAEEHDKAVLYHVDNHGCLEVVANGTKAEANSLQVLWLQ